MYVNLSEEQIDALLKSEYYGHLACHNDEELYLVPITYAYDNGVLVSYTHEGKKIDMLRKNPAVCIQVEHMDSPTDWQSAMCWGNFEEITNEGEAQKAALQIAERFADSSVVNKPMYCPLIGDISQCTNGDTPLPVIYRVRITKKTGKMENIE